MAYSHSRFKVVPMGNGISYPTTNNLSKTHYRHLVDGFFGRPFSGRQGSGSLSETYHRLGLDLRTKLKSGVLAVRESDGYLVTTLEVLGQLAIWETESLVLARLTKCLPEEIDPRFLTPSGVAETGQKQKTSERTRYVA